MPYMIAVSLEMSDEPKIRETFFIGPHISSFYSPRLDIL